MTRSRLYDILSKIKISVLLFILFEVLDIATTIHGLSLGMKETNFLLGTVDLQFLFSLKICVIFVSAILMQTFKFPKWGITIIVAVPAITVLWNILNLVLYYIG